MFMILLVMFQGFQWKPGDSLFSLQIDNFILVEHFPNNLKCMKT